MAPTSTPGTGRTRRRSKSEDGSRQVKARLRMTARRPRPSLAPPQARERRLAGANLPSPSPAAFASHSHITIIPREPDSEHDEEGASVTSETRRPIRTNPSFLTETDTGLDLHQRTSATLTDQHHNDGGDKQPATFADMARSRLGPGAAQTWRPDHMASHEPVPLTHYMKFKKNNRSRKGAYSPIDEGHGAQPVEPQVTPSNFASHDFNMAPSTMPPRNSFTQASHPIDALEQHFQLVNHTFGRPLLNPGQLQGTEGQRDGEVQFTIDGGGDIQAHSWSATQFQWNNVGLYSYRRKAIEGALGVRQLKGQKIGSIAPRNAIEHFLALAKQFEEESSMSQLSPTSFENNNAARVQQRPPPVAVPLVSPRPHRPSATFKIGNDLNGSMSTAGYGSQQAGLPTMNTFATTSTGTLVPPQRTMTKLSDGQAFFLGLQPPPSASMRESSTSSPTNPQMSPLSHRYSQPTTANTTFEQHKPSGYAPSLSAASVFSGAADLAKRRQMQTWHEEQSRLQQHRFSVEASREPIHGDNEPFSVFNANTTVPRFPVPSSVFNSRNTTTGAEREDSWPTQAQTQTRTQTQATPSLAPGSQLHNPALLPLQFRREHLNDLSWESLAQGGISTTTPSTRGNYSQIDRAMYEGLTQSRPQVRMLSAMSAKTGPTSPTDAVPISTIAGDSIPDHTWDDRQALIWPSKGGPPTMPTWKDGKGLDNDDEVADEDDLDKAIKRSERPEGHWNFPDEVDETYAMRHRGPYFTTEKSSIDARVGDEVFDIDFESQVDRLCEDMVSSSDRRAEAFRKKARALVNPASGTPLLSEAKVEEMATDPRHMMLFAVKQNIQAYQAPGGVGGDVWTRYWIAPEEKVVDTSEKGWQSYFADPGISVEREREGRRESAEDEVTFRGRGMVRDGLILEDGPRFRRE